MSRKLCRTLSCLTEPKNHSHNSMFAICVTTAWAVNLIPRQMRVWKKKKEISCNFAEDTGQFAYTLQLQQALKGLSHSVAVRHTLNWGILFHASRAMLSKLVLFVLCTSTTKKSYIDWIDRETTNALLAAISITKKLALLVKKSKCIILYLMLDVRLSEHYTPAFFLMDCMHSLPSVPPYVVEYTIKKLEIQEQSSPF